MDIQESNVILIRNLNVLRLTYSQGCCFRLTVDVCVPGREKFNLFYEVEECYSNYLSCDKADFAIILVLPIAIKLGYDIYTDLPLTRELVYNIDNIIIPNLSCSRLIRLIANNLIEPSSDGKGIGTGVSGGVDSTYTILRHLDYSVSPFKLTHLLVTSTSIDLAIISKNENIFSWIDRYKNYFKRYHEIGKACNLPVVMVLSNCQYFLCNFSGKLNPKFHIDHLHVHTYLTLSSVFSVCKLFKSYMFSSGLHLTKNFSIKQGLNSDPAYYELLLMYGFSISSLRLYSSGSDVDRMFKTNYISDFKLSQEYLHPCFSNGQYNCSLPTCNKCLRALLTFDIFDKLELFSNVFDIELYKQYKIVYWREMINQKESVLIKPLYEKLKDKYHDEIMTVENEIINYRKPVSGSMFNSLSFAYSLVLEMLKVPNLLELLSYFFGDAKKIYIVGNNRLVELIKFILKDREFYNFKNANVNSCDLCFVAETNTLISQLKYVQIRAVSKIRIITLMDLEKSFVSYGTTISINPAEGL